ncbi:unnamed protein product [Phytophthora lilii]|uniref:Unnamed protein product n=1 Tax=Phytophthora lilii TaxID=2077276 RepID=A0A9W6U6B8_9STRA|nr:unnamed protein product [Phytophthora lilii]
MAIPNSSSDSFPCARSRLVFVQPLYDLEMTISGGFPHDKRCKPFCQNIVQLSGTALDGKTWAARHQHRSALFVAAKLKVRVQKKSRSPFSENLLTETKRLETEATPFPRDWIWAASCTSAESRTPGWSLMNFLRSDPDYYRWQFSKSRHEAAERGDLKIAKWLFTHFSGCEASRDVVGAAVSRGHLHILRFLWDHQSGLGEDHTIVDEISNADTAALQRSCTVQFDDSCSLENWGRHAIEAAVDNGELIECLNDGMPLGDGDRQSAIECALQKGYLQFAEELLNPTKRGASRLTLLVVRTLKRLRRCLTFGIVS